MRNLFVALAAAVVLSACATANFSTPKGSGPVITGSQVYVYSFLDLRNDDLGARMVAQLNEQLRSRLSEHGVETQLVTFRETPQGRYTSVTGSVSVPVREIVEENGQNEEDFGADYRLLIMPTQMTIYDAAQNYQIIWDLVDANTGEVVWSSTMRGNRTVWYSANEDAEGRAATIVDGVISQMVAGNLITAAAPGASPPTT